MPDEPARPRSTALGRHPTCCLAPAKKKRGPHWTPPLLCPPIPASTKPAHPGIRHSFDQVARSMPCIKFFDSTFPALSGQDLAGEPIRLRALGCAQIQFLEKRDRFVYVVWKMPRIRPRGPKTPHSGASPSVEGFPEQDRGRRGTQARSRGARSSSAAQNAGPASRWCRSTTRNQSTTGGPKRDDRSSSGHPPRARLQP
jgi:hypothetical protein